MPKGVQRTNREAKKPKQAKKVPVPVSGTSPSSPVVPPKKK
jgi:hypothetical protein